MRTSKTSFLTELPHRPGVYQMIDARGKALYVGKAKDLKQRVSSYFSKTLKTPKIVALMKQVDHVEVTITETENEAILLECNLIKKYLPRYNVLLRDDKRYPYIVITMQDAFPKIALYRGERHKKNLYFGPYTNATLAREMVYFIQKLFKLRTCEEGVFKGRTRPCLLHQINRCSGPCVGLIDQKDYLERVQDAILLLSGKHQDLLSELHLKMQQAADREAFEEAGLYRDQIQQLTAIQEKQSVHLSHGEADVLGLFEHHGLFAIQLLSVRAGIVVHSRLHPLRSGLTVTVKEALAAFIAQYYLSFDHAVPRELIVETLPTDAKLLQTMLTEKATHPVRLVCPKQGKKATWLQMANRSAKQALLQQTAQDGVYAARWQALRQFLSLTALSRVECFDISHTQGEATIGSCVVFDEDGPRRRDYRYFNIQSVTPGDDFAAMHQVLSRRFLRLSKEQQALPDLILIDGGKTQLNAAIQVLQSFEISSVLVRSVSKGRLRKRGDEMLHAPQEKPFSLAANPAVLHFIQYIRDEAHRFAITRHRALRDKKRPRSVLESIPGIGEKRRQALLHYFGGIQGVLHASLEELTRVSGINRPLALTIFSALHDDHSRR